MTSFAAIPLSTAVEPQVSRATGALLAKVESRGYIWSWGYCTESDRYGIVTWRITCDPALRLRPPRTLLRPQDPTSPKRRFASRWHLRHGFIPIRSCRSPPHLLARWPRVADGWPPISFRAPCRSSSAFLQASRVWRGARKTPPPAPSWPARRRLQDQALRRSCRTPQNCDDRRRGQQDRVPARPGELPSPNHADDGAVRSLRRAALEDRPADC